jgi:5-methylcytosine-specific restriction protein A
MKGQVFTVAKLHYINGVVYFTAQQGTTNLQTIADNYRETTKSGDVKHPLVRVRTLARLAEGIGLLTISKGNRVEITALGKRYYDARLSDKWVLSEAQKDLLCTHILADSHRTATIYSISTLHSLLRQGHSGEELAREFAIAIGKDDAWNSDVTYKGFTQFVSSYIEELGLLERDKADTRWKIPSEKKRGQKHKAKTFLFTWNPKKWSWDDLPQAVYDANAEGRYHNCWSCAAIRQVSVGDRAFLMRLGVAPKGLMGSGVIVSEPFEAPHWNPERARQGDTDYQVGIIFDALSDLPIMGEEQLTSGSLGKHHWFPQNSGTQIPEDIALELETEWSRVSGTAFHPPDVDDLPTLHLEGTKQTRLVKRYERNSEAREECIRRHGTNCQVCGLIFEERYGQIGKGFIHVHHVVPVSEIGDQYQVDPMKDLRPVCPNCHAMLHKRTPPYTVEELRSMIAL